MERISMSCRGKDSDLTQKLRMRKGYDEAAIRVELENSVFKLDKEKEEQHVYKEPNYPECFKRRR